MNSKSTKLSAGKIATGIKNGDFCVTEVVDEHINRIEELNPKLNAVIWPLYDEAKAKAKKADEFLSNADTQNLPPLFGVPMTVKDQFFVKGTPVSCGLINRSKQIINKEGTLISRLRQSGAIILGKTNLPQLLISHECEHAHYGRANNPWNVNRTPGGSSGGEGAIIAAGGSPLGLGGDMGGSIRIPSHFCGIHGLKPTGGRFTNDDSPLTEGHVADLAGFEGFIVQPGPMARTVDDLKLAMDCMLSSPVHPPLTAPVPWENKPLQNVKGLKVGIYQNDNFFTPSPAIRRVVDEAGKALENLKVEVVPFEIPDMTYAIRLYLSLLCADGGQWIKDSLQGDKPISDVKNIMQAGATPAWAKKILSPLLGSLGQEYASSMLKCSGKCSAAHYWNLTNQRTKYRIKFVEAMASKNIDILICPPHGLPAPQHGSNKNGVEPISASYPAIFNLLDLPAGVVAASRVRENEQCNRKPSKDKVIQDAIKIETGSKGLPVGVQVVGKHWREDQVLAVMKALETHFKTQEGYPVGKI